MLHVLRSPRIVLRKLRGPLAFAFYVCVCICAALLYASILPRVVYVDPPDRPIRPRVVEPIWEAPVEKPPRPWWPEIIEVPREGGKP